MKRILSLLLSMSLLFSVCITANADNSLSVCNERMMTYLGGDNHRLLILRNNYSYMQMVDNINGSACSRYLIEMADLLAKTGKKPDKKKYMEVLINIISTYDFDNADKVSEQYKLDNLKSAKDYGMDIVKIGADTVSVMSAFSPSTSKLKDMLATSIDGISTLAENTDNWLEALSNLETIVKDYSNYDKFLEIVEINSTGDLSSAASTLRTSIKQTLKIKLDTYSDISDKNFNNYSEFWFTDGFFATIKNTSEYNSDDNIKFFTDIGENIVSKTSALKDSWELGVLIGKLVGNVTVGTEDLINRLLEEMAIYDISIILQDKLISLNSAFFNYIINKDDTQDTIEEYVMVSQYLIGCRIRGEYCVYSIIANNAKLLSQFNKKSADEAKKWYNEKTNLILQLKKEVEFITQKSEVEILSIDSYVRTAKEETFDYVDGVGNGCYAEYRIPEILLDSPDANNANQQILNKYIPMFTEQEDAEKNGYSMTRSTIDYDAYINGDILSVVVYDTMYHSFGYNVYNFDVVTGQQLYNQTLASKLDINYSDLMEKYRNMLRIDLETYNDVNILEKYGMIDRYHDICNKTFSDEYINRTRFFVGSSGNISAVAFEATMAGADSRYTIIDNVYTIS